MSKFLICKFFLILFLFSLNSNLFGQIFADSLKIANRKAKLFLENKILSDSCSPEVLLFLPRFQEQMGFEIIEMKKINGILENKKKSDPVFILYARFFEMVKNKPNISSSLDTYTLECLYWDFEKKDIKPMMNQMLIDARTKKGYDLTHLILRWYILKAQNCPYAHPDLISGIYEDWKLSLPTIQSPDLLAEYLAMTSFTGWQIPENELKRLIHMQNKDGGFPWEKIGLQSEPHSTFLAIWAISTFLENKPFTFQFTNQ